MSAPQLRTTYVICSAPRSGSHLLAEALQVTGLAGKPDEYFITNRNGQFQNEHGHIAELYGRKSLEQFHEFILSLGSTPNGVFGIIIQWDYLHHVFHNFRSLPQYRDLDDKALLNAVFCNPKFIWLQRRNKVDQAISWIKAEHTGVWRHEKDNLPAKKNNEPPAFDFFLIEENVERFENAEKAWGNFFATHQIDPFIVVYEDLARSFEQTSLALLDFLNIPHPPHVDFSRRTVQKQADSLNNTWAKRYVWEKKSPLHKVLRYLPYLRLKLLPTKK